MVWYPFLPFYGPTSFFPSSSCGPTLLYSLVSTSFSWNVRVLCNLAVDPPLTMANHSLYQFFACYVKMRSVVKPTAEHWSFARLNARKSHKYKSGESHVPRVLGFLPKNCSGDTGEPVCELSSSISVDTNFFNKGRRYRSHRDSDVRSPKRWL